MTERNPDSPPRQSEWLKKKIADRLLERERARQVHTEVVEHGIVSTQDANGRPCWYRDRACRVLLTADLRRHHPQLHPGSLGRTVPGSTDGYKHIEVDFDCGVRLLVKSHVLDQVTEEAAGTLAMQLIEDCRGTVFDADSDAADRCFREWIERRCEGLIDFRDATLGGDGYEDVYAYTFPSLIRLAELQSTHQYPVKIGYSHSPDGSALSRICDQIGTGTSMPEQPIVLVVWKTSNGLWMERQIHKKLRDQGRHIRTAVGTEWFQTSRDEVISIIKSLPPPKVAKKVAPASGPSATSAYGGFEEDTITITHSYIDEAGNAVINVQSLDEWLNHDG